MVIRVAGNLGERLQGRILGKKHFAVLCSSLADTPAGEFVLLDFQGVQLVTGSWVNAAILPLYSWAAAPQIDLFPVLCNLKKDWLDEFRLVAEASGRCFLVAENDREPLEAILVVGELEPLQQEAMKVVQELGTATGAGLKRSNPEDSRGATAWNNRLKDLYRKRLLRRVKSGREQKYYPIAGEVVYDG